MKDQTKTREQLINELAELHQRITELEVRENEGKRVEKGLRDSESLYRSLFDHIPVGLYRTTPAGQILDANPALIQMLGYPDRESLLAINAVDAYLNPESRIQWQTLMERDGVVRNFETQLRRADGSIVWAEESSRVVRDVDGRVLCYEGSFEDITER
jgi:PAS domain S-box-containing protein